MDWRDGGAASKPRPGVERLVGERPRLRRLPLNPGLHPGSAGSLGRGPQAPPSFCFLSAKQLYSCPLSRVVVTSAGHCAGVNSHVFTPVILATALRGGNYSYPHFPDGAFPDAGHGLSYLIDPLRYERVVYDFLRSIPTVSDKISKTLPDQFSE